MICKTMTEPKHAPSQADPSTPAIETQTEAQTKAQAGAPTEQAEQGAENRDQGIVDVQDVVYTSRINGNPREVISNPAVAPERLDDQAPEDRRDDQMPK